TAAVAECQRRGDPGERAGDGEVRATERRYGEVALAGLQPLQRLMCGLFEQISRYVGIEVVAVPCSATDHADVAAELVEQDGDRRVFERMVASHGANEFCEHVRINPLRFSAQYIEL